MKPYIRILLCLLVGLSGCATYRPLLLDDHPTTVTSISHLTMDAKRLPFPSLAGHKFDLSDGLDMTETAMLAVANNPVLKLARDDARIAQAQAFAAGLLPDPQFNLSRDFPRKPAPDTTSAFNAGLAYDLNALVTHGAGASAVRYDSRKTDLNLLWQEWQVVAQARLLFSRAVSQDRQLHWLTENRDLLADRYAKSRAALEAGNLTLDIANVSLAAWQDMSRLVNDLERLQLQTRHDLNALLGLVPGVTLKLVDDEPLAVPNEAAVMRALDDLPRRRPDLLALKAGYAAQDARYRQAILAQFPPLNLAFTRTRDTAGLLTRGFALSMALPLLNGNRGNIRIEEATRQRLHDEYQTRLNTAHDEVELLVADNRLVAAQSRTTEAALPSLDCAADHARLALADGNLDGPGFAALQSARIAKHVEAANLRQTLLESRIALLTLLGGDFPVQPVLSEHSQ
ncbi:MAG TPA: TolC family protein [Sulfuricella sp.]|nr:TolC family protein [Sulfuricella sp.]